MLLEDEQDSSGEGEFFSLFTSFTSRISHLLTCGEGKCLASEEEDSHWPSTQIIGKACKRLFGSKLMMIL